MAENRVILKKERFKLTIDRLCYQLIESLGDFRQTCLIGIQPRGSLLSNRLYQRLQQISDTKPLDYGLLDITFYRDDFRLRNKPLEANSIQMDFLVENKRVVLVDDVLYTGRTVQAALTALQHYGRPVQIELLTLVDRRFNRHLPIRPDYLGIAIDALDEAFVKVEWEEINGEDRILLFPSKHSVLET